MVKKMRRHGLVLGITLGFLAGAILASLLTANAASGVFIAKCKVARVGFIDPIVSPGVPSGHEHTLFGPKNIDINSTYSTMVTTDATKTTCKVDANNTTFVDSAGYWQPTLFNPNGTRIPVNNQSFYYRDWPGTSQNEHVTAFPANLKMVAGMPVASHHDHIGNGDFAKYPNWGFQCVNTDPLQDTPMDCPGGMLHMVINFPSCWDGVNTDSADHRSHMAYPTSGHCPADHPVKVPFLYQKVSYAITNCGTIGCYLSSDATMGVPSLHADFWNTWDQPTLQNLVDTVLNV